MENISTYKDTKIKRLPNKTAVIYARVSSTEQIKNFSIRTQLKECRNFLQNHDISEVAVFIEQGESAKSANRTQFQNLLTFLKNNKNKVDYLVCYKFDRFSRNTEDFYYYKAMMKRYGTTIKSVTEQLEDTPSGRFLETIYTGIAQLDNENKGERVKQCLETKALDGWYPSHAPYGYRNDQVTKRLVRDEIYFKHIRYCLKEYAKGRTLGELEEDLKKKGLKTMGKYNTKQVPFTVKSLRKIMEKSKFYAGVYDWGEHKDIKGQHEKMITWKEHLEIQRRLHSVPAKLVRNMDDHFVLNFGLENGRGFLTCSCCGARLRSCRSTGKGGVYYYYFCANTSCVQRKKSIQKVQLEDIVQRQLRGITPRKELVQLFRVVVAEELATAQKSAVEESKELKQRLKQLENEKEGTIAMRRRGELDEEDYNSEMTRIKSEIGTLSPTPYAEKIFQEKNYDKLLDNAEDFLLRLEPIYNTASIKKKRQLLKLVYPRGVTYGNGEYRTPEKSVLFNIFEQEEDQDSVMVRCLGLEPSTNCLKGSCSNLMS